MDWTVILTAVIVAAALVWAIGWLPAARRRYVKTRPYTEPLSCTQTKYVHEKWYTHEHNRDCYTRPGYPLTETANEAALYAAGWAMAWPLILPTLGAWSLLGRAIEAGDREDPAELRATIARLEHELSQQQPQP